MNYPRQTLVQLVEAGFYQNTTGVCLATKRNGTWHETSVADFGKQVRDFAMGLYALGVRPADRVALHAENSTEWLIADQAILSLGAVTVPIYPTQPGEQIAYILNNAEAVAYLVSTKKLYAAFKPHASEVSSLKATVGLVETATRDMASFAEVLEKGHLQGQATPELLDELKAQVQPDDLATFIYTSGTTGTPKGVMLTHDNLVSNVFGVIPRFPFDLDANRGHKLLSYLPLSHVFERMVTYLVMHAGYPIYFVEAFQEVMDDVQTVRPLHFTTVPRLLEKVYLGIKHKAEGMGGVQGTLMRWAIERAENYDVENPPRGLDALSHALADRLVYRKLRALFGGNLDALTSGGAALSADIMNFINGIGIFCAQGYGMTESSPVIAMYERGKLKAGSVGRALEGVAVQIAEDGEIWARGPNVMRGYYQMPEATAEVLTEDGWLKTGDIGHLDADGYLFITDRKKALMKLSTGKYVAPQPLEVALSARPFIEQVMVVGQAQKFCGALIVLDEAAVRQQAQEEGIALDDNRPLCEQEAARRYVQGQLDAVNPHFPKWEQVKNFTLLPEAFTIEGGELTPKLSLKRRAILEKHGDAVAKIYRR